MFLEIEEKMPAARIIFKPAYRNGTCHLWLCKKERWFVKDLVRNKVLAYLGRISYGIYVYHLLSIYSAGQVALYYGVVPERKVVYPVLIFTVALTSTVLISAISYNVVDKIYLRHKKKFAAIQFRPI